MPSSLGTSATARRQAPSWHCKKVGKVNAIHAGDEKELDLFHEGSTWGALDARQEYTLYISDGDYPARWFHSWYMYAGRLATVINT